MLSGAVLGLNCRVLRSSFSWLNPGLQGQKEIFSVVTTLWGSQAMMWGTVVSTSRSGGTQVRAGSIWVCPADA